MTIFFFVAFGKILYNPDKTACVDHCGMVLRAPMVFLQSPWTETSNMLPVQVAPHCVVAIVSLQSNHSSTSAHTNPHGRASPLQGTAKLSAAIQKFVVFAARDINQKEGNISILSASYFWENVHTIILV